MEEYISKHYSCLLTQCTHLHNLDTKTNSKSNLFLFQGPKNESYSKFSVYHPPFISSFKSTSKSNTVNPLQTSFYRTEVPVHKYKGKRFNRTKQKRDKIKKNKRNKGKKAK